MMGSEADIPCFYLDTIISVNPYWITVWAVSRKKGVNVVGFYAWTLVITSTIAWVI